MQRSTDRRHGQEKDGREGEEGIDGRKGHGGAGNVGVAAHGLRHHEGGDGAGAGEVAHDDKAVEGRERQRKAGNISKLYRRFF